MAENEAAVPVEGAESQFTTARNPPALTTGEAMGVTQTSATLTGTVNPEGEEVKSCAVEYGTTPSLGGSAPCASLPSTGTSPVEVAIPLAGLSPGTTYYYRLVAESTGGAEVGTASTFTTLAATPRRPRHRRRPPSGARARPKAPNRPGHR